MSNQPHPLKAFTEAIWNFIKRDGCWTENLLASIRHLHPQIPNFNYRDIYFHLPTRLHSPHPHCRTNFHHPHHYHQNTFCLHYLHHLVFLSFKAAIAHQVQSLLFKAPNKTDEGDPNHNLHHNLRLHLPYPQINHYSPNYFAIIFQISFSAVFLFILQSLLLSFQLLFICCLVHKHSSVHHDIWARSAIFSQIDLLF